MNLTAWFYAIREIGIDLVGSEQPDSFGPNVFGLFPENHTSVWMKGFGRGRNAGSCLRRAGHAVGANHPPKGEDITDSQRQLVQ
jgi:hypothetical protein